MYKCLFDSSQSLTLWIDKGAFIVKSFSFHHPTTIHINAIKIHRPRWPCIHILVCYHMEPGRLRKTWCEKREELSKFGKEENMETDDRGEEWRDESTYMTQGTPETGARRISGDGSTNPATNCGRGDISTVNTWFTFPSLHIRRLNGSMKRLASHEQLSPQGVGQ